MIKLIVILGLLLSLGSVGIYFFRRAKKAGQNESDIKHVKNANEGLKDENEDLASRPRTLSDVKHRLQQWRDKLPKNKD
jgi:cell shape-determining protein MreC